MGILYVDPSFSENDQKLFSFRLINEADDMHGGKVYSMAKDDVFLARAIGLTLDQRTQLLTIDYSEIGEPTIFGVKAIYQSVSTKNTKGCFMYGDVYEEETECCISYQTYLNFKQEDYQNILDKYYEEIDDENDRIVAIYIFDN